MLYLERLLECIQHWGGDILSISARRCVAVWRDDPDQSTVMHAIQTCDNLAAITLDVQESCGANEDGFSRAAVSFRIGVGHLVEINAGGHKGRWEWMLGGPAMQQACLLPIEYGEVIVSRAIVNYVDSRRISVKPHGLGFVARIVSDICWSSRAKAIQSVDTESTAESREMLRLRAYAAKQMVDSHLSACLKGLVSKQLGADFRKKNRVHSFCDMCWQTLAFLQLHVPAFDSTAQGLTTNPEHVRSVGLCIHRAIAYVQRHYLSQFDGNIVSFEFDDVSMFSGTVPITLSVAFKPREGKSGAPRAVDGLFSMQEIPDIPPALAAVVSGKFVCCSVGNSKRAVPFLVGSVPLECSRLLSVCRERANIIDSKESIVVCDSTTYYAAQIPMHCGVPIEFEDSSSQKISFLLRREADCECPTSPRIMSRGPVTQDLIYLREDIYDRLLERFAWFFPQTDKGFCWKGGVVILEGDRGVGKTSMLQQLCDSLTTMLSERTSSVARKVVHMTGGSGHFAMWKRILEQLCCCVGKPPEKLRSMLEGRLRGEDRRLQRKGFSLLWSVLDSDSNTHTLSNTNFHVNIDNIVVTLEYLMKNLLEELPTVLIVDEVHALEHVVSSRVMQSLIVWNDEYLKATGQSKQLMILAGEPVSLFRRDFRGLLRDDPNNMVVQIGGLSYADVRRLILRRVILKDLSAFSLSHRSQRAM